MKDLLFSDSNSEINSGGNAENEMPASKRRRKGLDWRKIRTFENLESAFAEIKKEETWRMNKRNFW